MDMLLGKRLFAYSFLAPDIVERIGRLSKHSRCAFANAGLSWIFYSMSILVVLIRNRKQRQNFLKGFPLGCWFELWERIPSHFTLSSGPLRATSTLQGTNTSHLGKGKSSSNVTLVKGSFDRSREGRIPQNHPTSIAPVQQKRHWSNILRKKPINNCYVSRGLRPKIYDRQFRGLWGFHDGGGESDGWRSQWFGEDR